jgi:shikimate kinase
MKRQSIAVVGFHHIVVIGLMGAGKTTIGRRLAARVRRPFVDNDEQLERATGRSAREIAAADGLDALHDDEFQALCDALEMTEPAVIAAAAAAIMEPEAETALHGHFVVYLRADPDVLVRRVAAGEDHRPLDDNAARTIHEQFAARDARYLTVATFVADASANPDDALDAITSALAQS